MSFKGMGKSIRMVEAPVPNADAPAHLSDEFPAGYSLTRCSPAELVSASPAEVDSASEVVQLWGLSNKALLAKQHQDTLKRSYYNPGVGE